METIKAITAPARKVNLGQVFSPCHGLCPLPVLIHVLPPNPASSSSSLSLRGSEPAKCPSPSPEPSTFLTWNLPARESIYPCSFYLSWRSPSNSLPLLSKETQHTAPSRFIVVPTPTSTSGCNDSLLIILTERGFYLLKHKNVTSILSKFLLPFGRH